VSVESALLSHLILNDALGDALDRSVNEAFFHSPRNKKVWQWAYEYWMQYGETPNAKAFRRQFPSYELEDTEEPCDALVDELYRNHRFELTKDGLAEAVKLFDNPEEDAQPALVQLANLLAETAMLDGGTEIESSSTFLDLFITEVLEYDGMEILGIPMGLPILDAHLGGLRDEQLITMVAPPKHGKSTWALFQAIVAERLGKKAIVISFEMSNREQKERYLSLAAGVSLTSIQRGMLTESEKRKIADFQERQQREREDGVLGEIILVHDRGSVMTIGGIAAKVEQLKPDLVIVDGVYMMQDEQGEKPGSSQALTNITRSFKRLCQKFKIPFVVTTQALLWKMSKSKGVTMDSIGYTSSFAQDSDIILGIDKDDLKRPESKWKVVVARNAVGLEVHVIVDLGRGVVRENGLVVDEGGTPEVGYGDDFD
jgi:hypothetical protein